MDNYIDTIQSLLKRISSDQSYINFADTFVNLLLSHNSPSSPGFIYFAGNGGSLSSSSHFATDVNNLFEKGFISLGGLTPSCFSQASRISNDYGYENIFCRDVLRYGSSIQAIFVLSVSGNSPNILKLLRYARDNEIPTFALLGFSGNGEAATLSDHTFSLPSTDFRVVEDLHMIIFSSILSLIDS